MTKRFYGFYLLVATAALSAVTCIRENTDDCPPDVTLHMHLHSVEQRHLADLRSVSVFVFDGNGLFLERYEATPGWEINDSYSSYSMNIPIREQGSYQFVIWTNADDPGYSVTQCERNHTRLQDASLEIHCGGDAIVSAMPAMLCYGYHSPVEVKGPGNNLHVQMKRYTSVVQVVIKGLDESITHSVGIEYGSRNYRFDEQEHESSLRTFIPEYGEGGVERVIADFRLVRLNESRQSVLKIADQTEQTDLMTLDLIDEVLGRYPGIDFTKQFEFLIEISLRNYVPFQIKVNDWIIVDEEI